MENKFEKDVEVLNVINNSEAVLTRAEMLEVVDGESQKIAVSLLANIKDFKNVIEQKRKFYTVPVNDILKQINATARKYSDPFTDAESQVKSQMRTYENKLWEEKRKLEEKNRKKMEKAVEKGKPIPVVPTVTVEKTVASDDGAKVTYRDNWIAEILDKKTLIKYAINNDLWNLISVNQSELNNLAKIYKDSKKIDGCQFVNNKIISTRS